jgi:hypothetical protein
MGTAVGGIPELYPGHPLARDTCGGDLTTDARLGVYPGTIEVIE